MSLILKKAEENSMSDQSRLKKIKSYYEDRYVPEDMGPSRRSFHTYQVFLDWLDVKPETKLLDVACGVGPLLQCAGMQINGWGTDLSERALTVAHQLVPFAYFGLGDMQRMAFADGCFDYVTNIGGLEHVPNMQAALNEMARVCASNGRLCIVVPNINFFWYKVLRREGTQQRVMEEHLLTLTEWEALIQNAGLKVIRLEVDPGPDIRVDLGIKMFIRGIVRRIALAITRLMPVISTYQFVFICEKDSH